MNMGRKSTGRFPVMYARNDRRTSPSITPGFIMGMVAVGIVGSTLMSACSNDKPAPTAEVEMVGGIAYCEWEINSTKCPALRYDHAAIPSFRWMEDDDLDAFEKAYKAAKKKGQTLKVPTAKNPGNPYAKANKGAAGQGTDKGNKSGTGKVDTSKSDKNKTDTSKSDKGKVDTSKKDTTKSDSRKSSGTSTTRNSTGSSSRR